MSLYFSAINPRQDWSLVQCELPKKNPDVTAKFRIVQRVGGGGMCPVVMLAPYVTLVRIQGGHTFVDCNDEPLPLAAWEEQRQLCNDWLADLQAWVQEELIRMAPTDENVRNTEGMVRFSDYTETTTLNLTPLFRRTDYPMYGADKVASRGDDPEAQEYPVIYVQSRAWQDRSQVTHFVRFGEVVIQTGARAGWKIEMKPQSGRRVGPVVPEVPVDQNPRYQAMMDTTPNQFTM